MRTEAETRLKLDKLIKDHGDELDRQAKAWISGRITILEWILEENK